VPVQYSYTSTSPMDRSLYGASVPVQYSYTSTPPIGSTVCTEPQCLYKGALYLSILRGEIGITFNIHAGKIKARQSHYRPPLSLRIVGGRGS